MSFIQSRLNVHPDTVGFRTSFENDVARHAFVKQTIVSHSRSSAGPTLTVGSLCRTACRSPMLWQTSLSTRQTRSSPSALLSSTHVRFASTHPCSPRLMFLPASIPSTTPSISLEDAISIAESKLSGKFNEHPATLEFVAKKDGSLALTRVMQIENDTTGAWFEAFVDAHSGELVQLTDFVAKASVSPAHLSHFPCIAGD